VLDFNPLPPSCTVKIKEGYRNYTFVKKLSAKIAKINGVDEVKYQKEILSIIDRYITIVYAIAAGAGLILIIISIVLLYNTIRLTIYGRRDLIEIMKLVGATRKIIRRPFIVEGFIEGLMGASIASLFLYGAIFLIKRYLYPYTDSSIEVYAVLLVSGAVIGMIASSMSLAKHLKEI
jgi:cell division transport system permease protein